jgi:vacuolar-type H+-ATPase subunit H
MSNFARWEQESRQPLGPLQPDIPEPDRSHRHQETMEVDMTALLGEEPAAALSGTDGTALHQIAEIQELLAEQPDDDEPDEDERDDDDAFAEDDDETREPRTAAARASIREAGERAGERIADARRSLATTGRTVGRWVASLDRRPEFSAHHGHDPLAQLGAGRPQAPPQRAMADGDGSEEQYIAQLEAEIAELRSRVGDGDPVQAPISITEEIERIGEETASILVVAHDKAHETARRAQEQAERRVRDADARAEAIVTEAQRRLRQLDDETDAVWRERERLLDDVRTVCTALTALVDDAGQRFPADPQAMAGIEIEPERTAAVAAEAEGIIPPEVEVEVEVEAEAEAGVGPK